MIDTIQRSNNWNIGEAEPEDERELSALFRSVAPDILMPDEAKNSLLSAYAGEPLKERIRHSERMILVSGGLGSLTGFVLGAHNETQKTLRLLVGGVRKDMRGVTLDNGGTFSDLLLIIATHFLRSDEVAIEMLIHKDAGYARKTMTRNGFIPHDSVPAALAEAGMRRMVYRPQAFN